MRAPDVVSTRRRKPTSTAARHGEFDGACRAGSDRYEDFDPTGGFIGRRDLSESDRVEYRAAYERGYIEMLRQLGRGRFSEVRP